MTEALKQERHFLGHLIQNASVKGKKSLFKTLTKRQTNVLTEIFVNILEDTFNLTAEEKEKLSKSKKFIRQIANLKKSVKKRKYLLTTHPVIANRVLKIVWPKVMEHISQKDVSKQANNQ